MNFLRCFAGCGLRYRAPGESAGHAVRWAIRLTAVVLGGAFLTVGPLAPPVHSFAAPPDWTDTPFGPLSPADRDMLVRVRLAGLWEIPSGRMAQERSESERVKEVGAILAADHVELDDKVVAVATKLGVTLPDQPSPEQQFWLTELSNRSGEAFDKKFTDRLRSAHGNVFSAIAFVRAGSRNEVVRAFAEEGVNVVMKHMSLLESTGLVSYSLLTPPPPPPLERVAFSERSGVAVWFVWAVLAVAIVAGVFSVARAIRPR